MTGDSLPSDMNDNQDRTRWHLWYLAVLAFLLLQILLYVILTHRYS